MDIGRHDLLTGDQEIDLPRGIPEGVEAQAFLHAQGNTDAQLLLDLLDEFYIDGSQALRETPLDEHEAEIHSAIAAITDSLYDPEAKKLTRIETYFGKRLAMLLGCWVRQTTLRRARWRAYWSPCGDHCVHSARRAFRAPNAFGR